MDFRKQDSQGRVYIAQHDVRGALVSASASLTTGTAATLLAGDADYFLDMIEVTLCNNSTVAAQVLLKNDGTTLRTIEVPAGGTVQLDFEAPLSQNTKNTTWVADLEDITGTQIDVGALFVKKN